MTRLVGVSGSLREGSFNTALLRAAADLVPEGVELAIKTPHGVPAYNGDLEIAEGIPASVADLKNAIAAAERPAVDAGGHHRVDE